LFVVKEEIATDFYEVLAKTRDDEEEVQRQRKGRGRDSGSSPG